jgi:putative DNA primase/helicase
VVSRRVFIPDTEPEPVELRPPSPNGHAEPLERSLEVSVPLSTIQPVAVRWLWPGRIPLAMPTVLAGFPGVGKSTIAYDRAARVTREGKTVVIATAEDHHAAVVRPRMELAGADLDLARIVRIPITLPGSVELLEAHIRDLGAVLLVIDPLSAFISDAVNTHRDHHVRRVLAPLATLAEETGAAVVVVAHTNKGMGSEPLMRISGSIGFTAAARSVLLAAEDPQDNERRILAVVKSNLAAFPTPLAYTVREADMGEEITTSRIEWLGEAPEIDARTLLAGIDPEDRTNQDDAEEFLRAAGVLEEARPARDLEREAKAQGIHPKALQRARRALGVKVWREGFQGPFFWGQQPGQTQPGQTHPVHVVQVEADQGKQGPEDPNLDSPVGAGEEEPGPDPFEGFEESFGSEEDPLDG